MSLIKKILLGSVFAALTATAFADEPTELTTYNNTNAWVSAKISGFPSHDPMTPHSERHRAWWKLRVACYASQKDDICTATIILRKNESDENGSILGDMSINMKSGEITPKQLRNDLYTLRVNDIAKVTITENS